MGVLNQFLQLASSKPLPVLQVVKTEKEYEERRLERSTWISTTISGVYQELAKIEGFKLLLAYITGQNEDGAQLKMVPPVLTRVTSSKTNSFESTFTVSLCIQAEEDKSLPEPLNPLVYIEQFPAMNVFVKPVDGLTNDEKWLWEARKLAELLQHKEHIRTDVYFTAAYENPLQLMCQENEVWLVKYESEGTIVPLKKHNTVNVGEHRVTMPSFVVRILSFMISCFTLFLASVSACLNFGSFARSNVHLLHKTFKSTVECLASKNVVLNFVYLTCLSSLNKGLSVLHWMNKVVNYR